jgi:hypothetical protein
MLIRETHFTAKTHFVIPGCDLCFTNHPDGTAHGGAAVIIKSTLAYYEKLKYAKEEIQAARISVKGPQRELTVTAVYSPPKHNLKAAHFESLFRSLAHAFWQEAITTVKIHYGDPDQTPPKDEG